MLPGRSARAGGSDAGYASTALRRPPSEKVPFSPLRRQYGGVPAGRQSVGGRARSLKWTDSDGVWRGNRVGSLLPEEGLEPTRTYAQALLRRPRLPFRHSGVPVIVSNASNARVGRPAGRVYPEYARWE